MLASYGYVCPCAVRGIVSRHYVLLTGREPRDALITASRTSLALALIEGPCALEFE